MWVSVNKLNLIPERIVARRIAVFWNGRGLCSNFLGFKEGRHLVEQQRLWLADIVLNSLKKYKVNTNILWGQGYDEAANVN